MKSHSRESCTTSVSHICCQSIHRNLNPGKSYFVISKDNTIVWSVRVHLFHINCHQVVDLVSYFHLCPTLLRRYINRWDHCPDESTVKLSKTFLSFIWRETAKIIWQFVGWMLLPFKWEKFANVWNLCIVSPLGAVLVHNLEGRGILSSAHNNHQSRKWNCQNWDPPAFSTIQGDPWWV